jgi:hypothetical protein
VSLRTTWLVGLASAGLALATVLTAAPAAALAAGDVGPAIIGGTTATENYPVAWIQTVYPGLGTARCTGTVVDGHYVVVAASCLTGLSTGDPMPTAQITVGVGSKYLNRLTDVTPTTADVPPAWAWSNFADLAVVTLPASVHLPSVPLSNLNPVGRPVRAVGWGKTSDDATAPPNVLQQLDTRTVEPADCAGSYYPVGVGEICVGQAAAGGAICFGDGPVLGRSPLRTWALTSTGSRETDESCNGPFIATDMAYWDPWIRSVIAQQGPRQQHQPKQVPAAAPARLMSHLH